MTIINKKFSMAILREVMNTTLRLTCMVFIILCGAAAFGLVFRGLGGDGLVRGFLGGLAFGLGGLGNGTEYRSHAGDGCLSRFHR